MASAVALLYYGLQAVFFVWTAVILGFFFQGLYVEVSTKSIYTPRSLWFICLCSSALLFLLLDLDPRGGLGLYPPAGLKFLEWITVVSVLVCVAITAYMYLIVLYKQTMSPVPPKLRNFWLVMNGGFSILHVCTSMTGAITNKLYWFGIDGILLAIHEIILVAVLNVGIYKLAKGLKLQTQQVAEINAGSASSQKFKGSSFDSALKKMTYVRVLSIVAAAFIICFQILAPTGVIDRLTSFSAPIPGYDFSVWSTNYLASPGIHIAINMIFLYMSRRPQQRDSSQPSSVARSTEHKSRVSSVEPSPASQDSSTSRTRPSLTSSRSPVASTLDIQLNDIYVH